MSAVFDALGGLAEAGRISGISVDALANWRDGKARPAFYPLATLCQAAGRSLDWLATGREPSAAAGSVPGRLFGAVKTDRLDEAFREALGHAGIDPGQLGDTDKLMLLTVLLYDTRAEREEKTSAKPPAAKEKSTVE